MIRARWLSLQLGYLALLSLLFHPFFFIVFRLMAFDTVPRDDYARYLLWLLHEPGAAFPGSLYGYRILSVLVAAPFYYALPGLPLTNLPANLDPNYLKATAALAAVSYLAMVASAIMAYRLVVDRNIGRRPLDGLFAAAFILLCECYAAFFGIDPLAFLLIICALYAIDRIWLFAVIIAASILFNEKVLIVFAVWLSLRFVFSRERSFFGPRLVVVLAAVAAYVAMLAIVRLEGHSEQLDANAYIPSLLQNVIATVTTRRGFILNVLPCLLLAGTVWWSWRALGRRQTGVYAPLDLLVIPALVVVTLVLTQFYQVGRIVMHAAPLFILPVSQGLGAWLRR
jgi:hypothetical protein